MNEPWILSPDRCFAPDPARRAHLLCASLDGLLLDHVATASDPTDLRSLAVELIERIAAP